MGTELSSPLKTEGKVDGRPVTFSLVRHEGSQYELVWEENESDTKERITRDDMIAVLPIHASVPDDYTVLYVAPNPAIKDNPVASPVIFKHFVGTNLPGDLVHAYEPPGNACWQLRQDDGSIPNLHIIVSSGSGTGQGQNVWEVLLKPMLQHVCPMADKYAVHFTDSESSVTDLTKSVLLPAANQGKAQSIILLSGDGGIVDIVNGLLSDKHMRQYIKPNIAILPLGTGNALAHSVGITADNTLGVKNLLQGRTRELPIFRVSFSSGARLLVNEAREVQQLALVNGAPTSYGAVVCSWGFHAGLVADSDTHEYRKHGAERFKMAAKEALYPSDGSRPHPYCGKVSVLRPSNDGAKQDWQVLNRSTHAYVLVTPVSKLEKGFTISPASRPLDGKLRLVQFSALSGDECMDIMTKAYDGGKHADDPRVGYEEIEGLRIEFDEEDARWRRICVDGKIVRVEEGGWVEARAGVKEVADLILAQ
ncbi:hypothetical protein LTR78_000821 [Recurvomyces mirabilis]|uniref:DAGKc domain-containing protein n=1 Tax=Recurvomyces mirabilis TaxID=574656 RepID=A0AAE0WX83_9PEZI|nr:hypothetical protein LTR78_000821 [Recurvomyces mirabilis]KAK5158790.1 hypothetical protein LTS14_002898 [Recurvomyces mirabilis]